MRDETKPNVSLKKQDSEGTDHRQGSKLYSKRHSEVAGKIKNPSVRQESK